ncbi:MAG: TetR/AcrR family transcriptional regulator [Elusimicrobia bacterium]|nr:TetR/AcrR family transcriptional regulator [Elusimicrobiota bacterium]
MPRPQNLEARERILEAAQCLFHEHGFKGVSMDDVASRARLKKANLFHYYPSKNELGLAVLERASVCQREGVAKRFSNGHDPIKTVQGMFADSAERMEKGGCFKGCFMGNVAQELSDENEKMRRKISDYLDFWTGELRLFLERHKAAGYFKKSMNSAQTARALVSLLEGATLMCKAAKSPEALKNAGAMAGTCLKALKA